MDPTKAKSRCNNCDMSPTAIEKRLATVDELRELALGLHSAERLGPIDNEPVTESASTNSADPAPTKE